MKSVMNLLKFSLPALIIFLVACNREPQYKIGISQCSRDDWRELMNEEIEREAMLHSDVEVEIRSADDSNEKQIEDIRYFIDNGFDAIVVAPNEANAITSTIKEAYDKGIPVLVFDRNINEHYYNAFQGADNHAIGVAAANYVRNLLDGHGNVMEIMGLGNSTPAIGRHKGFNEQIAEYPDIKVVATGYGDWNATRAAHVADSILSVNKDVDLIYAHNDRMAIAAAEVARKKGLDVKVIGIDAAPETGIKAVADDKIDATFIYPTEGGHLFNTAYNMARKLPYDSITIFPLTSAVDKTNADILLTQNQSLKDETHKVKQLKSMVDVYWERHSSQTILLYAVVAALILLIVVVFLLLRQYWLHKRHQKVLEDNNRLLEEQRDMQRNLNAQLEEATQSKLRFFTNVSHDLRTPITLISDPVEQLAKASNLTDDQKVLARIANKNVKILHRLINQILDFRKYEAGKLQLQYKEIDFAKAAREWLQAFRQLAQKRHIKLDINIADVDMRMAFDPDIMERVVFNLMSNALKFTPDNGHVGFNATIDNGMLIFSISDTGIGINAEEQKHLFEHFFRAERIYAGGSGIGLSLVKAFVELHNGSIRVESESGKGSKFIVEIPIRHVSQNSGDDAYAEENVEARITSDLVNVELDPLETDVEKSDADCPTVLVIDDNSDLLKLMRQTLSSSYNVLAASNGAEGLRLATKYVPDLIICDVMMPVMDGIECLKRLKSELTTSHIPVLMLTACTLDEQRTSTYDSGADGYMAKPFAGDMLLARCRNLIANRRLLLKGNPEVFPMADSIAVNTQQPSPTPAAVNQNGADIDSDFYNRFLDIFKQHISDSDLNVEYLASELGLGRSQFYRKIKALTNFSPVELIRILRMKEARRLLTSTDKTISEIAYEVGFTSPAYFSKCYKDTYGQTPSELRDRLSGN